MGRILTQPVSGITYFPSALLSDLSAARVFYGYDNPATYTTLVIGDIWNDLTQAGGGSGGNTVTVTNPGSQTGTVGTATSLQIQASDTDSTQTLTFSATGLPTSMSIASATGLISGTPSVAGTFNCTITAIDTTNSSGTTSFTWTIGGGTSGSNYVDNGDGTWTNATLNDNGDGTWTDPNLTDNGDGTWTG